MVDETRESPEGIGSGNGDGGERERQKQGYSNVLSLN